MTPAVEKGSEFRPLGCVWRRLKDFAGLGGDATYLWPRWIVLRAVGIVYVIIFAGIISEGQALIGPHGLAPIAELLGKMQRAFPHSLEPLVLAPSLFWLGSGTGMIAALEWIGLAAAIALILNLWPRMALFVCWLIFLSFVAAWGIFSPAQLDDLMLETALLCIPFAPAGFRPGLGAASPPRPIAIFTIRWLLFRIMFESGLIKIIAGDPHWHDLTAMDVMYEMAPFPTILGYLDHQLPHAYHLLEIALTFAAELVAPLVVVFAGRRGRWFAFGVWVVFQAGIQLTNNFGWLNTAAIAFGFLLLDDQMLAGLCRRVSGGRRSWPDTASGEIEPGRAGPTAEPRREERDRDPSSPRYAGQAVASTFKTWGLRVALSAHFYLTLCYFVVFARIALGLPLAAVPRVITGPANLFWNFHSANEYNLYATIGSIRYGVEFTGSDDGGRTWRTYEFKYVAQRVDRICPFIAPWFPRFETTIRNLDFGENKQWLFQSVAAQLIAGNPDVTGLFPRNPFPGHPPTMIRMRYYRLAFTDFATYRKTGHYWRKEYKGDYLPMIYLDRNGRMAESNLAAGDAALRRANYPAAFEIFDQQYRVGNPEAGFRLADMYARGQGVAKDQTMAVSIYSDLAARGEVEAGNHLGLCYEYGSGVPVDYAKAAAWYRSAAEHESLIALYNLGALYAKDRIAPADDIEGLTLLREAAERAVGDDPLARYVRQDPSGYARRLEQRMSPEAIATATRQASARVRGDNPVGTGPGSPN